MLSGAVRLGVSKNIQEGNNLTNGFVEYSCMKVFPRIGNTSTHLGQMPQLVPFVPAVRRNRQSPLERNSSPSILSTLLHPQPYYFLAIIFLSTVTLSMDEKTVSRQICIRGKFLTKKLHWCQTCARIPKGFKIKDLQDPRSRILRDLGSSTSGFVEDS